MIMRLTYDKLEKDILYRVYDNENDFIGIEKQDNEGFKINKCYLVLGVYLLGC